MDEVILYNFLRCVHIAAFVSWLAGMLYLPRLFVYHVSAQKGGEADLMLQTMERKLLRYIMNPAMIITWIFGVWLAVRFDFHQAGWFHAKFSLVIAMTAVHGLFASHRKKFAGGVNIKSARYFRILNEVPTLLMLAIIYLVIFKPF